MHDLSNGKELHEITSGEWRVREIIDIDEEEEIIYFTAGSKESDYNPYWEGFYKINFDGSNLILLTKENANHIVSFNMGGGCLKLLNVLTQQLATRLSAALMRPSRELVRRYQRVRRAARACALRAAYVEAVLRSRSKSACSNLALLLSQCRRPHHRIKINTCLCKHLVKLVPNI